MENIFEKMDLERFYDSLEKENKIKVCGYIMDNMYDFDENEKKDQETNQKVTDLLSRDREILKMVMDKVESAETGADDSDENVYFYTDEEVEKLVDDYKRLREKKLERILK
jgi:hypothetical protein